MEPENYSICASCQQPIIQDDGRRLCGLCEIIQSHITHLSGMGFGANTLIAQRMELWGKEDDEAVEALTQIIEDGMNIADDGTEDVGEDVGEDGAGVEAGAGDGAEAEDEIMWEEHEASMSEWRNRGEFV